MRPKIEDELDQRPQKRKWALLACSIIYLLPCLTTKPLESRIPEVFSDSLTSCYLSNICFNTLGNLLRLESMSDFETPILLLG